jgi:hypothetical protein
LGLYGTLDYVAIYLHMALACTGRAFVHLVFSGQRYRLSSPLYICIENPSKIFHICISLGTRGLYVSYSPCFIFFSFSFSFFVLCHTIAIGSWTGRHLECSFVLSPNSFYMKNLHKSSPKIERWVNTRETGRVKSRPVVSVRRAASNFCQRRVGWSAPKTCKQ